MPGSLKNLSGQEEAPAKAPSLIEVGTTRSEFGSLPNLQSQKNWQFALVRDGKDKTIRLKNGNRVFALRFDGDMTKDSYEKQQPVPLTRLGDLDEKDFLSGADVVSKGVFQVHRSTPNSIHGTLQDGKNNSSMIFEIGDDGKWMMRPKPKARLSQVAAKFVSSVGTGKQASMKCPECGKAPGKYRIHGDAIQCGSCEKTSDMEKWDKSAATDDEIRKTLKVYCVDLDGTLAHNDGRDFDPDHIGKPVPGMMRLVRLWLRRGHEVRIFTARAADKKNIPRIKEWLEEHGLKGRDGEGLVITHEKTPDIDAIYDDRAFRVERNTGKIAKLAGILGVPWGRMFHNKAEIRTSNAGDPPRFYSEKVRPKDQELVTRILMDQSGINDPKVVTPQASWNHDLKFDDLDKIETIMGAEEEFGVDIPDEDVERIDTAEDLARAVAYHTRNKNWSGMIGPLSDVSVSAMTTGKIACLAQKLGIKLTHYYPEEAEESIKEYAIQKSQERSKMGSLFGHFKVAGIRLPNIPVIARVPAVIGETAGAVSNGTFIDGFGKGMSALEKGVNTAAGLTGAADLANTALTTIKPLGSMLAVNAPLVSGGLSMVAKKIAPPVWAASMAMQTGQAIANPAQTAAESHEELSNTPLLGRVWAGASNPPKAILGGAKAVYDAGGAVADYAKGEMRGTISALKNWYNTSGPGSLHHQPIKKSGGLIGKYLQVLRDRFCAARKNVNASPSEAQIKAQNYRMGHVWVQGLDITIESPKGSTRSGMDSKGNKWSVTMKNDYGYIRNHPRSEADGDHVDVFVGDHPDSEVVFVIDQFIDGKWDEHKVVVGAKTEKEARQTYLDNYAQKNWKGLRSITALTMRQFKKWLTDGDTSKPLAGQQYRDFLKTAEHDIQYPKIIGDIVHSDLVAKPALAIGSGALRGMAVASIIHALRRAKRDAFDQSHRGLSLLKDLGTGAMIGAGTGLLAHAIPPVAENLYDTFDVQPDSKLQKLSAHFMDVVLAPVNSTPGIGSVLGAGYGALAGAGKGIYRRTKGFLTGDPPEPDAIKNDIIDGMAQGANYGAYFGLTGPNPPRPDPKTKVVNTSEKLKKMRTVIPRR